MSNMLISARNIVRDKETGTRYRVIFFNLENFILCEMNTTKFILIDISYRDMMDMLAAGEFTIEDDEEEIVFDEDALTDSVRKRFVRKRDMMREINRLCGPDYISLAGKKTKAEVEEIRERYGYQRNSFWRIVRGYLQSGMDDASLVDGRALVTERSEYHYEKKTGRPPTKFEATGKNPTDEDKKNMDEAIEYYKKSKESSLDDAYERMLLLHYTSVDIVDGVSVTRVFPIDERPTFKQLLDRKDSQMTARDKQVKKTSAAEARNNKRLLEENSTDGVNGPGDMVEIDACETDISLVSSVNKDQAIGRPVVYFMLDVYTRIILAFSVAFDNNSFLGVTNLFMNLADDKEKFCERYGKVLSDPSLWPSNVLPRRIRTDRGAEFKGKDFMEVCNRLGIELQNLTGASGSLKGVVESEFHSMQADQNVHLEGHGLITKRYDSDHHRQSELTVEDYTKLVLEFVLYHNMRQMDNYPRTPDMIIKDVKPVPIALWDYGVKLYGSPRPMPPIKKYLYDMMQPQKASFTKNGIKCAGLLYIPDDDPALEEKMLRTQNRSVKIEVRMDPRCVDAVYYIDENSHLQRAGLKAQYAGFADYTLAELKELKDKDNAERAHGKVYNQELGVSHYLTSEAIVKNASKGTYSSTKDMRPAKAEEKQRVSASKKLEGYVEDAKAEAIEMKAEKALPDTEAVREKERTSSMPKSKWALFEEAMDTFDDEE